MQHATGMVAAIPALGLLAGCAFGLARPEGFSGLLIVLLAAAAVTCAAAVFHGNAALLAAAVALGFGAGGALLAANAWRTAARSSLRLAFEDIARDARAGLVRAGRFAPEDDTAAVALVGVLRADAALSTSGTVSLSVAVRWIGRQGASRRSADPAMNPVSGGVLLTVGGTLASERMDEWRAGRTIRAVAQLRRVSRYLDPGVPDQERVLALKDVALVGSVKSAALVDVIARGSVVAESAAAVRLFARRAIARAVAPWSTRSAAIVAAIVIGDRTGLDPDVEKRLQEAGTYHVIAISGGNIAILAGLAIAAFRLAGLLGRGAMLTAIGGLIAYGYLVGGGASVNRATLMAVVYFAGRAIDLRGPPLNTLALVAGLLALADPLSVADPAFLLTFGATLAILVVMPLVPVRRLSRAGGVIITMLAASAAAEAALIPVSAYLFSRITLAGLVLNFAAIPLMAVAQIAGMVLVPLAVASDRAALAAGAIAHLGAAGLVESARLVEYTPAFTWRVAPPAGWAVWSYYVALVASWILWRLRDEVLGSNEPPSVRAGRRAALIAVVVAGIWIVAEPWALVSTRGDGHLHVTFIDVGQGDAAFVTFPHGSTALVDAGGLPGSSSFDIGDRVVAPVLRQRGVHRLDTLAVTHGDSDHVGGALSVLHEFRPWEVWEGIPVPPFAPLRRLRTVAIAQGSRWANMQAHDRVLVDDVEVRVHHPGLPAWERQDVRNDDSLVIELRWCDVSVVLTGDIGRESETTIASEFEPAPLRVLKVPHHGSLTSSSEPFVAALAPAVVVVSVGRSNAFGHPAPAVLARYDAIGAEIFRTDRDGAVTVDTDGTSLIVHTFSGRKAMIKSKPGWQRGPTPHHDVTMGTMATTPTNP